MKRLFFVVLVAAFSALVPGSASAASPVISHYTQDVGPFAIADVCTTGITVSGHLVVTETDYFDASGAPTRIYIHTVETDTFSGPGRSLVSEPYEYGTTFQLDTSGSIVGGSVVGVLLRIQLPDRSLFLSSGRVILHPNGPAFTFTPDFGRSGNLGALCGALGA